MFAGTCQAKGNRASETLGKSLKRQTMVCLLAELAYVMLSPLTEFFQLLSGYGGKDTASASSIQPEVLGLPATPSLGALEQPRVQPRTGTSHCGLRDDQDARSFTEHLISNWLLWVLPQALFLHLFL